MIKFVVKIENTKIQFLDEDTAREYAEANGGNVSQIDETPTPRGNIQPISPRQIRLALLQMNVSSDQVIEAFSSLEEPTKSAAIIAWEYSLAFDRYNELVDLVANAFSMSTEQIDELWLSAALL